jgi:hypothetical protein
MRLEELQTKGRLTLAKHDELFKESLKEVTDGYKQQVTDWQGNLSVTKPKQPSIDVISEIKDKDTKIEALNDVIKSLPRSNQTDDDKEKRLGALRIGGDILREGKYTSREDFMNKAREIFDDDKFVKDSVNNIWSTIEPRMNNRLKFMSTKRRARLGGEFTGDTVPLLEPKGSDGSIEGVEKIDSDGNFIVKESVSIDNLEAIQRIAKRENRKVIEQ